MGNSPTSTLSNCGKTIALITATTQLMAALLPWSALAAPAAPPPSFIQTENKGLARCERKFIYEGKELDCDSQVTQDGEKLRPIFVGTPSAISELDAYQRGKRDLSLLPYIGSAGLLTMVAGFAISRPPFAPDALTTGGYLVLGSLMTAVAGGAYAFGGLSVKGYVPPEYPARVAIIAATSVAMFLLGVYLDHPPFRGDFKPGGFVVLGGLGLGIGAFSYAQGLRSANQGHLNQAVVNFNQAHPDRPIELKVTVGF